MNKIYGDWTVLKQIDVHYYLCRCKCGIERRVYEYNLKRGLTTSCGCSYRRPLTGKRFGKLLAIGEKAPGKIICRCDCGTEKVFNRSALRGTRSCGCSTKQFMRENNITHGLSKSSEYAIWNAMLTRCFNKKHPSSKNYGRRGITVCKRWMKFENFLKDMGHRPSKKHCLDRSNNKGNYCKSNCKWATWKEQQNNRRSNVLIRFNGKTLTISQWADSIGVSCGFIWKRINRGWSINKALTKPTLRPQWKRNK